MKIQFLNGGLANQAFQYIFTRHYSLAHPGEAIYLDDSYFALNTIHNGYELEKVFGIKAPMLSGCFSEDVWAFILEEKKKGKSVPQTLMENGLSICMVSEMQEKYREFNPFDGEVYATPCNKYNPEIQELPGNVYYHGYWINRGWFAACKRVILDEFRFPELTEDWNQEYARQIESSNSVSIHIRRGDYVPLNWSYSAGTHRMLVDMFRQVAPGDWTLFVFSDDIPWCRENAEEMGFGLFEDVVYVEGNMNGRNYRDLQLMSMCKGMILSGSAFCYLAALLNTHRKYIINPTKRET